MDCFLFVEDWLGSSLGLDMRARNSFVNGADLQILSQIIAQRFIRVRASTPLTRIQRVGRDVDAHGVDPLWAVITFRAGLQPLQQSPPAIL
jgi:hypothetical protein